MSSLHMHDSFPVSLETSDTPAESRSRFQSIGFGCALVFVFLRFSALPEVIASITSVDTYLPYVFGPIAILAAVASGSVRRVFKEKPAKFWLWFVIWMALGIPFSSWKGGSFGWFLIYVKASFVLVPVIAALATKWSDCTKIIYTIALAALFNMATAYFSKADGDRLTFSWSSTLGNSNDFAAHMLLVLPFLLFITLRPGAGTLRRLVCIGIVAFGLFQILRTASRGALVALLVTIIVLFMRGSVRQKVGVGLAGVVAFVFVTFLLPTATWQRLTSFSKSSGASQEALESSEEREYLLKQSFVYTLQHPVFGLGLGQFASHAGKGSARAGLAVAWHEAHNSYTQISSECGIPALGFHIAAVLSTFILLAKIRKNALAIGRKEMATAAYCITIGLFAYSVAVTFVNFGYNYELPAMSGLVIAMWFALRNEPQETESSVELLEDSEPESALHKPWLAFDRRG